MKSRLCPICDVAEVRPSFRPFCSAHCARVDLLRWLDGHYAIPGAPADEADDSGPAATDDQH